MSNRRLAALVPLLGLLAGILLGEASTAENATAAMCGTGQVAGMIGGGLSGLVLGSLTGFAVVLWPR